MQKLFKSTLIAGVAALITTTSAHGLTLESPIMDDMKLINDDAITITFGIEETTHFNLDAKIGIARLDKGRLIPAPMGELADWKFLDKRSAANFEPVSVAAHIKNLPEIDMDGRDTSNQIDEIRLTASDLKMDYVLVYGMGGDAQWGSIGGKALIETGLRFDEDEISPRASAKALLVDTYTGEVYGTVTSEEIEFGVGDLTDKVDALIDTLISNEDRA